MISVPLRELNGRPMQVDATKDTSVKQLKNAIIQELHIEEASISLILHADVLADRALMSELHMEDDDFIVLHREREASDITVREIKRPAMKKPIPADAPVQKKPGRSMAFMKNVDVVFDMMDGKADKGEIIVLLEQCGNNVDTVINMLMPENRTETPKKPSAVKVHDVSELGKYDFGELSHLVREMTNTEQAGLLRVLRKFPRRGQEADILQTFMFCDKDPIVAEGCLHVG